MPIILRPDTRDTEGRGLLLVDTLATAWGVEPREHGKAVWFELDLTSATTVDVDESALLAAFPG